MNKNFFKATGRAAKITGKDVKELRKHFNKKTKDAPLELSQRSHHCSPHLRRLQDQGRRTRC